MKIAVCAVTVSLLSLGCGGAGNDGSTTAASAATPSSSSAVAGTPSLVTPTGGTLAPPTATVAGAPATAPTTPAVAPTVSQAPAAPLATAPASAAGAPAAGAPAAPPATTPIAGSAAAAAGSAATTTTPAAAGACPAGEMCQVSSVGGFKFCSAMMQPLPPSCGAANSACGSDMKGMCLDASAIGFSGTFCLHNTCM